MSSTLEYLRAGVSRQAVQTDQETEAELMEDFREWLLEEDSNQKGYNLYSPKCVSYVKTLHIFNLLAKNTIAMGCISRVTDIVSLYRHFDFNDDYELYDSTLLLDYLYIEDFFYVDGEQPLSRKEQYIFQKGLKELIDEGSVVSVLSDSQLKGMGKWWDSQFLLYLESHIVNEEIK